MKELLKKDIRLSMPVMLVFCVLVIIEDIDMLLFYHIDLKFFGQFINQFFSRSGGHFFYLLIKFFSIFLVCLRLINKERDESSIDFLFSLPVSRWSLLASKLASGGMISLIFPFAYFASKVIAHLISRNSIDHSFYMYFNTTFLAADIIQSFIFFTICLSLAFLRNLSWIIGISLFIIFMEIDKITQFSKYLNIFNVNKLTYYGQYWQIEFAPLYFYLPLMLLLTGLVYLLYEPTKHRNQKLATLFEKIKNSRLTIIIPMIGLFIFIGVYFNKEKKETVKTRFRKYYAVQSKNYNLVYPEVYFSQAVVLVQAVDRVYDRLSNWFQFDIKNRILVDLSSSLIINTGGLADWQSIYIDIGKYNTNHIAIRDTFMHESVHVFIDALSDYHLRSYLNHTLFFHEGLATYLENLFSSDKKRHEYERYLALSHYVHPFGFTEILNGNECINKRERYLLYASGAVFIKTLIADHGKEGVLRILHSFKSMNYLKSMAGYELWDLAFQRSGFELAKTIGRFEKSIENAGKRHRQLIKRFPQFTANPFEKKKHVGIRLEMTNYNHKHWVAVLRFKNDLESNPETILYRIAKSIGPDRIAFAPKNKFSHGTYYYQVGFLNRKYGFTIYNEWSKVKL